ncbi:hypothetical protein THMIRHAS_18110 [Thiosulfatimonas sediminis]|uniref:Calcineurin-like phosphoesterase domain-containing protein n=1 Tax=Thiosulfatimonas sediminis TaxID=2675054 RepID=A0A6F8PWR3_9GAMM|nr:metallophosphoesterase [Thiosulfatimonas sediminis]BBP46438.1 hypothetical protein THMIRHAS_18110 [Thiosulfatimonas sediminis]
MTKLSDQINLDTWIVSDTHFGHEAILTYEPTRAAAMQADGFSNQNEWMIHQWNRLVDKTDLVLHLGDFAFKGKSVIEQLNGCIVLLIGNHDVKNVPWYRAYQKQFPERFQLIEEAGKLSEPIGVSGLIKTFANQKVFFSHYPLVSEDPFTRGKAKATRDAMAQLFIAEQCAFNIHGHVHSNDGFTDKTRERNVSWEKTDFQPIQLKELLNL